jgi:hypothetical protein
MHEFFYLSEFFISKALMVFLGILLFLGIDSFKLKDNSRKGIILNGFLIILFLTTLMPWRLEKRAEKIAQSLENHFIKTVEIMKNQYKEKGTSQEQANREIKFIEKEVEPKLKAFDLSLAKTGFIIFDLIIIGFYGGVIYFFSRPKVKERFE